MKTHTIVALANLGLSSIEIQSLRKIERTLHRWAELECGDGYRHVERDETTGIPYVFRDYSYLQANDPRCRSRIPDREKGALKRLADLMANHPRLTAYHQSDPRGCSLYIVPNERIGDRDLDSCYSTVGVAVC